MFKNNSDQMINQMPDVFDEPIHVGRPNIGDRRAFMQLVKKIVDSRWLTNDGPMVQELEKRISRKLDVKHCIAICNGTLALEIAIRALGLSGEVIVPSWTFIATAHALYWQGLTPVFADVNLETQNLDPESVVKMITPRTTGIIGVHLWGRPAPVENLENIAKERGLKLMFDASHAFGCQYKGSSIGKFGECEVLSFHATKIFNTFEGGAIVTNNGHLAQTVRLMRNFGFAGYDNVVYPGTNGKMPEINAAMGLVNLEALPKFIEKSRENYYAYVDSISKIPNLRVIEYDSMEAPNYHYVVLEVDKKSLITRNDIITELHKRNVLARKYFWPGCHRMKPYSDLFPHAGLMLPNTIAISENIIVLPNSGDLSLNNVELIGKMLSRLMGSHQ